MANGETTESVLLVSGAARIDRMAELVGPWREALASDAEFVIVDLGGVDSADATLIQALLALRRSLAQKSRHLFLRPLPEGHPVLEASRLLGIPLEHHFTLVGDGT